jgi:hypothetical protein
MTKKERGISDVIHAYMHRHKSRLNYAGKITVKDFILHNKGAIKAIYDRMRNEYEIKRTKELDKCLVYGVESFLDAEGMLGQQQSSG